MSTIATHRDRPPPTHVRRPSHGARHPGWLQMSLAGLTARGPSPTVDGGGLVAAISPPD